MRLYWFLLMVLMPLALSAQDKLEVSEFQTLEGHSFYVRSVAFSPDGQYLASGSSDETIKLWNPESGKLIRTLEGHSGAVYLIAFSPNGQYLASGSYDNTIELWNPESGKLIRTFEGHSYFVTSVAFSPDGKYLASCSIDETIKLWNPESGKLIRTLKRYSGSVNSVAFSLDGQYLASSSDDETIKLWNPESGKLIRTLEGHSDNVISVAFSPDGQYLASGSGDNTIKLWNPESGKLIRTLEGHSYYDVNSVAFSTDGHYLASGSADKTIKLWNPESGKLLRTLEGHSGWVYSVAFSPDGQYLASGSRDETIKIWQIGNLSVYQEPSQPPQLALQENTLQFSDANGDNRLNADESAAITFTLANEGKGLAQGLDTRIKQTNSIRGLSYEVAKAPDKIQPGEEKAFKVRLEGSRTLATGKAKFRIQIKEHFGFDASPVSLKIPTQEFQPPNPVIADHVFTAPATGELQKGVAINLKLAVQNRGKHKAEDVTVSVKTPENVLAAGKEEFDLGGIKPGQNEKINYSFFTNNRYEREEVPIEVKVSESYGKYGQQRTFKATLEEAVQQSASLTVEGEEQEEPEYEDPSLSGNKSKPTNLNPKVDLSKNLPEVSANHQNDFAVVIGNSQYQATKNVQFADQDAQLMKRYLVEVLGFKQGNVFYLENASKSDFQKYFGTKANHKGKLYNTIKQDQSDVFIYYSGHGAPSQETKQGYFVPTNADPSYLKFQGYALSTFYDNLSELPAQTKTVVLDACFSGADLLESVSSVRIEVKDKYKQKKDMAVLASSTGTQYSTWYDAKQHGLFTWFFLKAIKDYRQVDTNDDRQVTLKEIHQYISDNNQGVPYYARRLHGKKQEPKLMGGEQEEVLFEY